jgi:chromosome condensin MukBEF ATPase and DNA-binding subunit MukB
MKEKRDETIILRLSKTEKNRIYEKMLSMGIRNLSAYIRKMALDGYCLNLDLPQLRRMAYLLQNCSNNLNQVAKRANENGKIYSADLADLRTRLDELIDIGKQILSKLAEL